MTPTLSYAAQTAKSPLAPWSLDRREVGPNDIQIEIAFCGVCHSDLHTARGEWAGVVHPVVPGHEIVGTISKVGAKVSKFKVGDLAGVGCMVDTNCGTCPSCRAGEEQYCDTGGTVFTYNSPDNKMPGKMTYGGYTQRIVVDENFGLHIPKNLDLAAAAPLLCAGITLYSPLKHWGAGPGKTVGIVGLGGLGHMGVKLAHALGAKTVLFTTSASKVADGKKLGADEVVISKDAEAMKAQAGKFDLIINTVAVPQDLASWTALLKRDGNLVLVGAPESPHEPLNAFNLLVGRKSIAGSIIGGIKETQEMLDFCAKHKIVSDIEIISIQKINEAYERMLKSDVKYRFVIDMSSLK